MIRIVKKSKYIMVLFIIISFFSAASVYSSERSMKLYSNQNDFISDNAISLSINGDNGKLGKSFLELDNDFVLLKNDQNGIANYGVFIKGEINKIPRMLKGRFFTESDFQENKKVCVIGKIFQDQIINRDGIDYFYYKNDYYEVIGVLGDQYQDTPDDCSFYYNLDLKQGNSIDGEYYFDARENTEKIYSSLENNSNKDSVNLNKKILEKDKYYSEIASNTFAISIKDKVEILTIIILNVLLLTEFWIKSRTKEIGIKRAFGANKLRVSISIIGELIVLSSISFFIGYGLYLIISYLEERYLHFYAGTMIIVFVISIASALIASIVPILNANKIEPIEIIK